MLMLGVIMVAAMPNRRRVLTPVKAPFKPSPRPRE